jgi:hypothetical protein
MSVRMKTLPLFLFLIACVQSESGPDVVFTLPSKLSELSGMTLRDNLLYTIQDSGNKAAVHVVDLNGKLQRTIKIRGAHNSDWEDIASDDEGNLYIGDIGNNLNQRFTLQIYKVDRKDLGMEKAPYSQRTEFSYPDQRDFPPKKSERYFDAEAFFFFKGYFYLFTMNRSTKHAGFTTLYRISAKDGKVEAERIGQLDTCQDFHSCAITAADISPDGKRVALLSGENVWILENFTGDRFLEGKATRIPLGSLTQKEALCFAGNATLYIGDERDKATGGKVYRLDLK